MVDIILTISLNCLRVLGTLLMTGEGPWFLERLGTGILVGAGAAWFWPFLKGDLRRKDAEQQKQIDALERREAALDVREAALAAKDQEQQEQLDQVTAEVRELQKQAV